VLSDTHLKISFGGILCPDFRGLIIHHDFASAGLSLVRSEGCAKKWEIRKDSSGKTIEIKPKMINLTWEIWRGE